MDRAKEGGLSWELGEISGKGFTKSGKALARLSKKSAALTDCFAKRSTSMLNKVTNRLMTFRVPWSASVPRFRAWGCNKRMQDTQMHKRNQWGLLTTSPQ